MPKVASLNLPKNIYYSKQASFERKLSVLLQEDYIKAYDKLIQQCDFNIKALSSCLSNLGYYHNNKIIQEIKEELLRRKIWKRDGTKVCICGFRTDSVGILGNHRRSCPEHNQLQSKIIEELSPNQLDEWYDKDILPMDAVKLIMNNYQLPKDYYNFVYNLVYKTYQKYSQEGKIKWFKDCEKVKRANYDRAMKTVKEKYGVDNPSQLEEIKLKKKLTSLRNYGVTHHMKNIKVFNQMKKNIQKKYNVDNISQLEEVKRKKEETFMKHYGVKNIFQRTDLIKKYWKEKLNVNNPIEDLEIRVRAFSKGIKKSGTINTSEFEVRCYKEIYYMLKNLNIKSEIYVTNDSNNYFVDKINNKIRVPDFSIFLPEYNINIIIEAQDKYHKNPIKNKQNKQFKEIWEEDLERYKFFVSLSNTLLFTLWNDIDLKKQIAQISKIIKNTIFMKDDSSYIEYINDLFKMYEDALEDIDNSIKSSDNHTYGRIKTKSGREIATF